jgi:hypothetical protein
MQLDRADCWALTGSEPGASKKGLGYRTGIVDLGMPGRR